MSGRSGHAFARHRVVHIGIKQRNTAILRYFAAAAVQVMMVGDGRRRLGVLVKMIDAVRVVVGRRCGGRCRCGNTCVIKVQRAAADLIRVGREMTMRER